mgnify:CR=1 FL=1
MSNKHKHPTISFRVNEYERQEIEARILASGMLKKDYFVRSCINNRICVVGKKETIYPLVEKLQEVYVNLSEIYNTLFDGNISKINTDHDSLCNEEDIADCYSDIDFLADFIPTDKNVYSSIQHQYISMLKAIIDLLDGAKYLWEGNCHD